MLDPSSGGVANVWFREGKLEVAARSYKEREYKRVSGVELTKKEGVWTAKIGSHNWKFRMSENKAFHTYKWEVLMDGKSHPLTRTTSLTKGVEQALIFVKKEEELAEEVE